mmetsp:Transcript_18748/g.33253  ORF Transcript_18748/g.33253 Transcript_18748/m.33253 type:complete len:191 (-) Transcript_18748:176-748(-)
MACKFYDGFKLCEGERYFIQFEGGGQPMVVDTGKPTDSLAQETGLYYFKTDYSNQTSRPPSFLFQIHHSSVPGNFHLSHDSLQGLHQANLEYPERVESGLRCYREVIAKKESPDQSPRFRLHNNYDGTVQLRTGEANYVLGAIHNGPEVSWQKCCPLLLGRHTPQVYFFSGGYRSSSEGSFTRARINLLL